MGDSQDTGDTTNTATAEPSEQTRTKTPSWVPDTPTPGPIEDVEPDPEEPDEPDDAAQTAETDEPETDPGDNADEPDAPKGHQFDKGVQKLQQRQAAAEKRYEQLESSVGDIKGSIGKLTEMLTAQRADPKADDTSTREAPQAKQQEATVQADDLLAELDEAIPTTEGEVEDEDYLTLKQARSFKAKIKDVVGKVLQAKGQSEADDLVKQLSEKVEKIDQSLAEQQQQETLDAEAEQYWTKFESDNGFDGQSLWQEAQQQAVKENPNDDPAVQFGIAKALFKSSVASKQAEQEQPAEPAKKPAKNAATPRKTPPNPTTGTQTVSPGATTSQPTTRRGYKKPPSWRPD